LYREIKKKKLILNNRKPYRKEVARFIHELNTIDLIHSSIRLDGNNLSRNNVERIVKGEFVIEASVSDHAVISNYSDTIKLLYDMNEMDVYLNEKYLFKIYSALTKPDIVEYRKSNPVLRMIGYNPPHFKEIEEQMEILFNWLYKDLYLINPIEKAAYLHNKLIEIYPFETASEAVARMAAQYLLISKGYPPILWNISEQEYFDAISLYIKTEDVQPIYDVLERGIYNKLEIMMQLTAE
jgi:Fic family protein